MESLINNLKQNVRVIIKGEGYTVKTKTWLFNRRR